MLVHHLRLLASRSSAPLGLAALGLAMFAAWTAWFLWARVAVFEVSQRARIEVAAASHPIDAPVAGRVMRAELELGRVVAAGDVLLVLDAENFELDLARQRAEIASLTPQIEALQRQEEETVRALSGETRVAAASRGEAQARQKASETQARLATMERRQLDELRAKEMVADVESQRQRTTAERQDAELEAARAVVGRLGSEQLVRRSDRRVALARLERELASLIGDRAQGEARVRVLEREIALRTVRAPVGGRLGYVVTLRPGSVVEAATRIAVIVPRGELRAVAQFEPSALGRIRIGQVARLRFHAFPWTKYGTLPARVRQVGTEPAGGSAAEASTGAGTGLVRVELTLEHPPGSRIPMEHGLVGVAEVEVERMAPVSLLLDAAGRFLTRSGAHTGGPIDPSGPAP